MKIQIINFLWFSEGSKGVFLVLIKDNDNKDNDKLK